METRFVIMPRDHRSLMQEVRSVRWSLKPKALLLSIKENGSFEVLDWLQSEKLGSIEIHVLQKEIASSGPYHQNNLIRTCHSLFEFQETNLIDHYCDISSKESTGWHQIKLSFKDVKRYSRGELEDLMDKDMNWKEEDFEYKTKLSDQQQMEWLAGFESSGKVTCSFPPDFGVR